LLKRQKINLGNDFNLGGLASANSCHGSLNLIDVSPVNLMASLRMMSLIRKVERRLADGRRNGLIGGPVHLGVGQEAIAVGVSQFLCPSDFVFGAHRSHSHLLALGSDIRKLFAEVLGRETGHSKGMGGSMHLWDQSVGFYGSVPIVAGTVSLAVGAGMAARLQNTSNISVAYFGDGACEEGVVHESLNLASIQKDPVLFVVENNLFASHMHISIRQPKDSTARFAEANKIPYRIVDGNDVIAIAKVAKELIAAAREGKGPGFLEAVTYRWYGHVDWREDVDVGVKRSQKDIDQWRAKDPIRRLKNGMINAGIWSQEQDDLMNSEIRAEVDKAWALALDDPYPDHDALLQRVYSR
jgi:TPP-dependent pyruvate/acetoin dehydrogenase alpha subunit